MSSANSASPNNVDDDYFNDLSRGLSNGTHHTSVSPPEDGHAADGSDAVPRPKRIACVVCRKRKLRCDGNKPSCGTCSRLQHDCAYDEVRRKSGPKRGYVKQLEARLAQVETLLKTQDPNDPNAEAVSSTAYPDANQSSAFPPGGFSATDGAAFPLDDGAGDMFDPQQLFEDPSRQTTGSIPLNAGLGASEPMTWEMIGLGIDEPLPTQDVVDELYQIYFEKMHPSVPMIHRRRFLAAMNLAPHLRPPVSLRYAMWCLAASSTDKYTDLQHHFYQRARKYAEADEMKGHGEHMISIAQSQCWTLIATYEFKMMYFPRAWMSTGRGIRLAQMMGLHRLDGVGLDVKQCLPPPRDWTEREERRRTFWMAFCSDRYASIGTGWPVMIEEKDILTNLPASDEAFDKNKPQRTLSLKQATTPSGASSISALAGVVLMASLFGQNLIHLHRPDPNDNDDDLNGEFWRRHRNMDAILSNTSLSLPPHLRLPAGMANANIVYLNMNIHTSTICLHQAAIFKADKNRLPAAVSAESKIRCITAAAEIASIMRMISHLDLCAMNPFISFCLYVAARVFVQYIKSRPEDEQVRASLQFLLQAMEVMKRKNPLTESFLVQLEVDLEGSGMDNPNNTSKFAYTLKKGVAEIPGDKADCVSSFHLQQSQAGSTPLYSSTDSSNSAYPSPSATLNLPSRQKPTHSGVQNCRVDVSSPNSACGIILAHPSNMDPGRPLYSHSHTPPSLNGNSNNGGGGGGEMDLTPDTSASSTHDSVSVGANSRPSPSTLSNSSKPTYTPPSFDEGGVLPKQGSAAGGLNGGSIYFQQQQPEQQQQGRTQQQQQQQPQSQQQQQQQRDFSSGTAAFASPITVKPGPPQASNLNGAAGGGGEGGGVPTGFGFTNNWDLNMGNIGGPITPGGSDMFSQMMELGNLGSWGMDMGGVGVGVGNVNGEAGEKPS